MSFSMLGKGLSGSFPSSWLDDAVGVGVGLRALLAESGGSSTREISGVLLLVDGGDCVGIVLRRTDGVGEVAMLGGLDVVGGGFEEEPSRSQMVGTVSLDDTGPAVLEGFLLKARDAPAELD
jgi:hypothetical protein